MVTIKYTKKVSARRAEVFYDGSFFVKVVLEDDIELEMEDVLDQRLKCFEFTGTAPHVLLAVAGRHTSSTREVRDFTSKNVPEGRVAEAVVIKSYPVRLMGSVYINFNKPNIPTKMFELEIEAEQWLNEQLELAKVH